MSTLEIRKLLESENSAKRFRSLQFFCEWALHSKLDRAGALEINTCDMPRPIVPLALGALLGKAASKSKDDFQAVKGRKKKDGTTGKAYVRKKAKKKKSDSWF